MAGSGRAGKWPRPLGNQLTLLSYSYNNITISADGECTVSRIKQLRGGCGCGQGGGGRVWWGWAGLGGTGWLVVGCGGGGPA